MGRCVEFGTSIDAACDHPMVAGESSCSCDLCGTRCTGRFAACPEVWASSGSVASFAPSPHERDTFTDLVIEPPDQGFWADEPVDLAERARESIREHPRAAWSLVAAAVALTVAGVSALVAGGSSGSATSEVQGPLAHRFPRETVDGITVGRVWQLSGPHGSRFRATLELGNPDRSAVDVRVLEVVPKSLARTVDLIRFEPDPVVIDEDPVVRWDLHLRPGETRIVGYRILVDADGLRRERLAGWADDRADAVTRMRERARATTTTSTSTTTVTSTVPPPTSRSRGGSAVTEPDPVPPEPAPPATPPPPSPSSSSPTTKPKPPTTSAPTTSPSTTTPTQPPATPPT